MIFSRCKQLLTLFTAAILLSTLTACGKKQPAETSGTQSAALTEASVGETGAKTGSEAVSGSEGADGSTSGQADRTNASGKTQVTGTDKQPYSSQATNGQVTNPSAPAFYCEDITVSAGEKNIPVSVMVRNNPGYAFVGLSLYYDPALTCHMTEGVNADYITGDAGEKLTTECMVNTQKSIVGFGAFHAGDLTENGTVFTCFFDLPADAKPGQTYQFRLEMVEVTNASGKNPPFETAGCTMTVR